MKLIKPSLPALCVPLLFSSCGLLTKPTKQTPVVMVHGIFDDGESFGPLKYRLCKAGYRCYSPDLSPSNGKDGMQPLVDQLNNYIKQEVGEQTPYHLVGYSMGGVIARSYLRDSRNRAYCVSLTTLASPHHGTKIAKLYPLQAGVELRPGSDYLTTLNQDQRSYHQHTLSIRTAYDGIIIPSQSSELEGAENIRYTTPTHPSLLISRRVAANVLNHLNTHDCAAPSSSLLLAAK